MYVYFISKSANIYIALGAIHNCQHVQNILCGGGGGEMENFDIYTILWEGSLRKCMFCTHLNVDNYGWPLTQSTICITYDKLEAHPAHVCFCAIAVMPENLLGWLDMDVHHFMTGTILQRFP